jgi:hypothetical protein
LLLLGDLVAGDSADDTAEDGAFSLVTAAGDSGAERAAGQTADDSALAALGLLADRDAIALARIGRGGDDGRGGEAKRDGDENSFGMRAHGGLRVVFVVSLGFTTRISRFGSPKVGLSTKKLGRRLFQGLPPARS